MPMKIKDSQSPDLVEPHRSPLHMLLERSAPPLTRKKVSLKTRVDKQAHGFVLATLSTSDKPTICSACDNNKNESFIFAP